MSKLLPVNGRIILEPKVVETGVGIILRPESFKDKELEKPEMGIIVSFDDTDDHPLNKVLKIGMRIVFNKYAGTSISRSGEANKKYYITTKEGVLAIYLDEEDGGNVE